ncbi:DUF4249 domain-containing protein [Flagellimonas sp.]|uniref:DUF4249 domain-containing protein n=1 Tax=Flagellimonas sp. TaxID=2058762 RepID=UPI003BABF23C|tara:strand:+ start:10509 stop:11735 length:1227 start_codon:yes stop_codon:yes gene_type:complete
MSAKTYIFGLVLCGSAFACVESFDATSKIRSDTSLLGTLVVEANITGEEEIQRVFLSSVQALQNGKEEGPLFKTNTTRIKEHGIDNEFQSSVNVEIRSDNGAVYAFEAVGNGSYESMTPFAAMPNVSYQLFVSLSNGLEYASSMVKNEAVSVIDSVYARRTTSNDGSEGIGIFIDGRNMADTGNFFNYSYVETYKIIAPNWDPFEFVRPGDGTFSVAARTQEERVCFNSRESNEIIQAPNVDFDSTRLEGFMVRFLGADNFFISHRYSIEIKQQIRSQEAFEFYNKLSSFSSSENIFSQVQPGFLEGNIRATNSDSKVIGFFDVVSVSKKRIFFNYEDFFPNAALPPYPFECTIFTPSIDDDILSGRVEFVGNNENPGPDELPYFVTFTPCGDCTQLGSNVEPDFWIE